MNYGTKLTLKAVKWEKLNYKQSSSYCCVFILTPISFPLEWHFKVSFIFLKSQVIVTIFHFFTVVYILIYDYLLHYVLT